MVENGLKIEYGQVGGVARMNHLTVLEGDHLSYIVRGEVRQERNVSLEQLQGVIRLVDVLKVVQLKPDYGDDNTSDVIKHSLRVTSFQFHAEVNMHTNTVNDSPPIEVRELIKGLRTLFKEPQIT